MRVDLRLLLLVMVFLVAAGDRVASTLARGYAIAHVPGAVIVRDATQAPPGTPVVVTVGRGSFGATSTGEIAELS